MTRAGWFLRTLRGVRGPSVLIIGHPNSDPDAVFSGIALKRLLLRMRPELSVEFGAPESISEASKRLLSLLGFKDTVIIDPIPRRDSYILVDTSSIRQLGWGIEELRDSEIYMIDHHMPQRDTLKMIRKAYVDPDSPSTAELVFNLYEAANLKPSRDVANGLLAAIIYETRKFSFGRSKTFVVVSKLIGLGADYTGVISLLRSEMGYSERIARLKAASRLSLYVIDNTLIAVSHVGAYEGSAARALIELGADIAVVGSENEEVRLSARRRSDVALDLNVVLAAVAEKFGGIGGGHSAAAGLKAKASLDRVFSEVLSMIEESLGGKLKQLK